MCLIVRIGIVEVIVFEVVGLLDVDIVFGDF